ncbi:MAG: hypothetical protein ABIV10_16195 [Gemmatimonadaceae bacterium]
MKSLTCFLPLLLAPSLAAQSPAKIPVRPLPAPSATSTETVRSLAAVRQLPNGNLLVNDQVGRRVLLMDSTLVLLGVVADSTSSTASAYGPRGGGLIAYRGDSTLFVDPASLSMLVIDPAGKIARVMAAPRPNDVQFLTGGPFGTPGFDARGRLVYRAFSRPNFGPGGPGAGGHAPVLPDSDAIVRFDLASRTLDTAGFFKVMRLRTTVERDSSGVHMTSIVNPMPIVDEWVVMSDGAIAIVRGQDYHVDFISADGSRTKGEKVPFDWQRLNDEQKTAFIDSTKAMMTRVRAAGVGANAGMGIGGGAGAMSGGQMVIRMDGPGAGVPGGPGSPPRGGGEPRIVMGGPPGAGMGMLALTFVSPSELSDYMPVFGPNAVRADADGRLWVRTIPTKLMAGALYEVIDRSGTLVDRVLVPEGATIIGFGAGGVVYMGKRDASGIHVQRARVK